MPVLMIKAIKARLDKAINYAINPQKTCVDELGRLGADPMRAGSTWYATALNSAGPRHAYGDMVNTHVKFGQEKEEHGSKRLAYRFIQSFSTGEATPEQAHAVGVEFARRCFGDRHEIVVGSHLDTETIHNHIIVNAVSFVDGKKIHTTKGNFLYGMRGVSDQVAKEHGLSVIENPRGRGKHYAEYQAEKKGEPVKRDLLRHEIDAAIKLAYTFEDFISILRNRGNDVRYSPTRTYVSVQPMGSEKHFRLTEKSLGAAYTVAGIKERLALQRAGLQMDDEKPPPPPRYRSTQAYRPREHRKLKGFIALYYHYLFFLKVIKKGGQHHRLPFSVREDVVKAERYQRQFLYMYTNGITTETDLQNHKAGLEQQVAALVDYRLPLYKERRNSGNAAHTAEVTEKISKANAALRELRKARKICENIEADAERLAEKHQQAEAAAAEKKKGAERTRPAREKPDTRFKL